MIIWIKHFTNASDTSEKLIRLVNEHGPLKYGEYWLLLEGLGRRFDGVDKFSEIFISVHDAKAKMHSKSDKKFFNSLEIFSACELLSFKKDKNFLKVVCPILWDLMDKDSKYNRKRIAGNDGLTTLEGEVEEDKKKKKNKEVEVEIIPGSFADPDIRNLIKHIPKNTQTLWLKTYPDSSWLIQEFHKMITWLAENPQRGPKSNVSSFIGRWLRKGWQEYGKVIPGKFSKAEHRVPTMTPEEVEEAYQLGVFKR